ncbi:H-type small acid-soluble spore protein [Paenibacillus lemnae]|uniref:H-type small acid-soluble spore protein n=1 Tax=Paenibacillus lemnae TaxID=1330551 RepID=A0A848M7A6_PAELE|nr:H-type small acid-soluble spore protein [Paenibacillus lemnae]NMO95733.1 H-type small acid-soluble spore protein [Paenibacillus lemnae]
MELERAMTIFESPDTFKVNLAGQPVWIEEIDQANGMATVQVGSRPTNTMTVSVDRLQEEAK